MDWLIDKIIAFGVRKSRGNLIRSLKTPLGGRLGGWLVNHWTVYFRTVAVNGAYHREMMIAFFIKSLVETGNREYLISGIMIEYEF